jgi:1-pyrroline-5-carboxylate dehydrogenase
MGNQVVVKADSKVSACMQEFVHLLLKCGMPKEDLALVHSDGANMEHYLKTAKIRMTQFTGSSRVANRLAEVLKGKIKIEDAGFDWKITGPDVMDIDYAAWVCDQDAFAISGQKMLSSISNVLT